jgi:hypothetical protein
MAKPTTYRREVADKIIAAVSRGSTLDKACSAVGIARETAERWREDNRDDFGDRLKDATFWKHEVWADQIIDFSDQSREAAGDMALLGSFKLSVDSRKWILSKMRPDLYGDRVEVNQTGTTIQIFLPSNQRMLEDAGARLIEGEAAEQLEDGSNGTE